jgi:hypothetical protein
LLLSWIYYQHFIYLSNRIRRMKRFFLLVIFSLVLFSGYSQIWTYQRYEVWGGVSVFQYFGDVGGSADRNNLFGLKDISFKSNRPGVSLGGMYRVDARWYIQASNSFGFFTQTDKGSRNEARNFSFNTIANETSIQGVYYIVKESDRGYSFSMKGKKEGLNQPFSIYAFAGIGSIYYRVTSTGTPDSRFVSNKHLSIVFPIGLGLKIALTPKYSLGIELGPRYTFTDYLDGLTTASSKFNDVYYVLTVKAYYRFPRAKQTPTRF